MFRAIDLDGVLEKSRSVVMISLLEFSSMVLFWERIYGSGYCELPNTALVVRPSARGLKD